MSLQQTCSRLKSFNIFYETSEIGHFAQGVLGRPDLCAFVWHPEDRLPCRHPCSFEDAVLVKQIYRHASHFAVPLKSPKQRLHAADYLLGVCTHETKSIAFSPRLVQANANEGAVGVRSLAPAPQAALSLFWEASMYIEASILHTGLCSVSTWEVTR